MKQQDELQIVIVSGTNRIGSYSMKVAENLKVIIEQLHYRPALLDLSKLPQQIFNSKSYNEKPAEFIEWQTTINKSDALLFCVPEYNGGIPGILKYFMDMLEYPDSVKEKPAMLLGISAGNSGAVNALEELTRLLKFQEAKVYEHRITISKCMKVITENGAVEPAILSKISTLTNTFINFCASNRDNHG